MTFIFYLPSLNLSCLLTCLQPVPKTHITFLSIHPTTHSSTITFPQPLPNTHSIFPNPFTHSLYPHLTHTQPPLIPIPYILSKFLHPLTPLTFTETLSPHQRALLRWCATSPHGLSRGLALVGSRWRALIPSSAPMSSMPLVGWRTSAWLLVILLMWAMDSRMERTLASWSSRRRTRILR